MMGEVDLGGGINTIPETEQNLPTFAVGSAGAVIGIEFGDFLNEQSDNFYE